MFAMMVIHACSYFLRDKTTLLIWDSLQWAVPVFLFCSFWLFYDKTKEFEASDWLPYLKKRLTRLLIPYYYFLAAYFPLLFFFQRKNFNAGYLAANAFLYKGIDFNWLVLLFVYLIFLMPVILIMRKNKIIFYGYFAVSLIASVFFIFQRFNYRIIMWLPWSVFIYFTLFYMAHRNNKKALSVLAVAAGALFLILRYIEVKIGHNLTQYANKYPPTLYHLSFGMFWVIILRAAAQKNYFSLFKFDRLLHFLSVNSYSLYFIHILVMFTLDWLNLMASNWPLFFIQIISITSAIQIFISYVLHRGKKS